MKKLPLSDTIKEFNLVLKLFFVADVACPLTIPDIQALITKESTMVITIERLQLIIDKLLQEKLIKELSFHGSGLGYVITFDGSFLYQHGGYKAFLNDFAIQRRQVRNSYYLTLVIAIGAFVASLYYICEIVKMFYPDLFAEQ